jgi:hypothetical protein
MAGRESRIHGATPLKPWVGLHFPNEANADVAQLAEQLICNQQVIGSTPIIGSITTVKG